MYDLIRDIILPIALILIAIASIISTLTSKKLKGKKSNKIPVIVLDIILIVGGIVLLLI